MLDISGPDFLVLLVAALFILGPERLPGAARWLGRAVRQVRDYATKASDQIQSELGPEFDELRAPLHDLARLRTLDPRAALTQHLLDATGGYRPQDDVHGLFADTAEAATVPAPGVTSAAAPQLGPRPPTLVADERPPFDADAT